MDGTFRMAGSRYVLSFERRLRHSPASVWRVLTERELLKQWFPADIEGAWEVGAKLTFAFLHGEGEGLPEEDLLGEVLEVDPPRLLVFRWGKHTIRCEVIPEGGSCRLLFSETLNDPSWAARNAAGWEMCLESLERVLAGVAVSGFEWDAWRTKFQHYVAEFEPGFGPQAGPPEDIHKASR